MNTNESKIIQSLVDDIFNLRQDINDIEMSIAMKKIDLCKKHCDIKLGDKCYYKGKTVMVISINPVIYGKKLIGFNGGYIELYLHGGWGTKKHKLSCYKFSQLKKID